jgi:hypothetical protein
MAARLTVLCAGRALPPEFFIFKDSWYSFLLEDEWTPGPVRRGNGTGSDLFSCPPPLPCSSECPFWKNTRHETSIYKSRLPTLAMWPAHHSLMIGLLRAVTTLGSSRQMHLYEMIILRAELVCLLAQFVCSLCSPVAETRVECGRQPYV